MKFDAILEEDAQRRREYERDFGVLPDYTHADSARKHNTPSGNNLKPKTEMNDSDIIYCAYEGDDMLGKYATEKEAEDALEEARKIAGSRAKRRIYKVIARRKLGGERYN